MSEENKDNVVEAQEVQEQTAEKPQEPMSHRDENWELVTFLNFSFNSLFMCLCLCCLPI